MRIDNCVIKHTHYLLLFQYTYSLLNTLHLQNDITLQHCYKNALANKQLRLIYDPYTILLEKALMRLDDAGVKT
jgi:hypothetical protein